MARLIREPARLIDALEFVRGAAALGVAVSWELPDAVDIGVRPAHIAKWRPMRARRDWNAAYGPLIQGDPQ